VSSWICRRCKHYQGFTPIKNVQTTGVCLLKDEPTTPDSGSEEFKWKEFDHE